LKCRGTDEIESNLVWRLRPVIAVRIDPIGSTSSASNEPSSCWTVIPDSQRVAQLRIVFGTMFFLAVFSFC
jgi:hypothetical protein